MDKQAAWDNHNACLAMFITGTYTPPVRLHTLKTCLHPRYHGPCLDKDCARNSTCKGNRIEMDGEGEDAILTYVAPHHKNEGKGDALPITFRIPPGQLSTMLLAHITEGQYTMTIEDPHPLLFTTKSGKPFNDSTLPMWWEKLVSCVGGMPHFPPNKARTIYVEHNMQEHAGESRGPGVACTSSPLPHALKPPTQVAPVLAMGLSLTCSEILAATVTLHSVVHLRVP